MGLKLTDGEEVAAALSADSDSEGIPADEVARSGSRGASFE